MIDGAGPAIRRTPFPHLIAADLLPEALCEDALAWLETSAPWSLRIASFYEQWELHLGAATVPALLQDLCAPATIARLVRTVLAPLGAEAPALTEITAHKLLPRQTIRIHNDFLPEQETHRILVQLNRGWRDDQGGLLMLFASASADDIARIVRPQHGSGFGFSISANSFHAVSTINRGERYTLVYSFKSAPAP